MRAGYPTIITILFVLSAASGVLLQDNLRAMNPQRQPVTDNYNVFLITVDTLRSDHVSCYGYERNITPNMCGATEEPIVFENAYAQAPWSLQSFASLMSGIWPFNHGVTRANFIPSNKTQGSRNDSSKGDETGVSASTDEKIKEKLRSLGYFQ